MTKKHLQFCIYYMQTGDQQVAYKMAYPRAAVKSLKASASRLMARPDVAEWVNGTEERVHNRMMRQFHNEHYDEFKEKLLTINEKRTVLTKIIKGETKRVRYVKVKYGVQKVEEDLSADTVLRAIDLDTRLENFYNYLTRSDTWRKTQNIYVNTPTLQQQVNILISKAGENAENVDTVESIQINSPTKSPRNLSRRGREGDRGTLAQDTPESELVEEPTPSPEQALSPAGGGVTLVTGVGHSRRTDNTSPPSGDLGVYSQSTLACTPTAGRGPDTHEPLNVSPRNLSRHGREGDRGTFTQDTPESELVEEPTPSPEQALSPAACLPRPFRGPDDFGSGGDPARLSRAIRDAGTGVGHSRRTDTTEGLNMSPLKGDRGTFAPKKTPRYLSAKSTGLSQKKNTNRLTTVNNLKRHQDDNNSA
ncbi:MAG: hypothetical protein H3C54_01750 [Taibaiella sp.]|nr:hypothetical protein [Taibaiella sp.]